eukprot:m.65503 g.65503  ORF g.65503 m.65503 type:complete len:640 (-) comp9763_c0_seq1:119-2038(-)
MAGVMRRKDGANRVPLARPRPVTIVEDWVTSIFPDNYLDPCEATGPSANSDDAPSSVGELASRLIVMLSTLDPAEAKDAAGLASAVRGIRRVLSTPGGWAQCAQVPTTETVRRLLPIALSDEGVLHDNETIVDAAVCIALVIPHMSCADFYRAHVVRTLIKVLTGALLDETERPKADKTGPATAETLLQGLCNVSLLDGAEDTLATEFIIKMCVEVTKAKKPRRTPQAERRATELLAAIAPFYPLEKNDLKAVKSIGKNALTPETKSVAAEMVAFAATMERLRTAKPAKATSKLVKSKTTGADAGVTLIIGGADGIEAAAMIQQSIAATGGSVKVASGGVEAIEVQVAEAEDVIFVLTPKLKTSLRFWVATALAAKHEIPTQAVRTGAMRAPGWFTSLFSNIRVVSFEKYVGKVAAAEMMGTLGLTTDNNNTRPGGNPTPTDKEAAMDPAELASTVKDHTSRVEMLEAELDDVKNETLTMDVVMNLVERAVQETTSTLVSRLTTAEQRCDSLQDEVTRMLEEQSSNRAIIHAQKNEVELFRGVIQEMQTSIFELHNALAAAKQGGESVAMAPPPPPPPPPMNLLTVPPPVAKKAPPPVAPKSSGTPHQMSARTKMANILRSGALSTPQHSDVDDDITVA